MTANSMAPQPKTGMPVAATGTTTGMPVAPLSPERAATHAGVSRTTIRNAMEAQKLKAFRDNRQRWKIHLPDLEDWMSKREPATGPATRTTNGKPVDPPATVGEGVYEVRIEGLEALLASHENTIADLQADLADMAEKRDAAEAKAWKLMEDQVASAERAGILEGKVGLLTDQLGEAQAQLREAQNRAKEAEERAKASENAPKPSGGILARVRAAIVGS